MYYFSIENLSIKHNRIDNPLGVNNIIISCVAEARNLRDRRGRSDDIWHEDVGLVGYGAPFDGELYYIV